MSNVVSCRHGGRWPRRLSGVKQPERWEFIRAGAHPGSSVTPTPDSSALREMSGHGHGAWRTCGQALAVAATHVRNACARCGCRRRLACVQCSARNAADAVAGPQVLCYAVQA